MFNLEADINFHLQELNKCKTELQFWRSKSPAIPAVCSSCNQKVTPVVPPEDFQVLVNQGVDPEHFIIINEEAEAEESDVSVGELKEFASPDETTTAKLLAVSTAAKNLKRKLPSEAQSSNAIASTSKPVEAVQTQPQPQPQAAVSGGGGGGGTVKGAAVAGGYSPKLFYGNHQRSGVIVSPVSMKLATAPPAVNLLPGTEAALEEPEDAKKARRVQKANRYVNTSSGKRSK